MFEFSGTDSGGEQYFAFESYVATEPGRYYAESWETSSSIGRMPNLPMDARDESPVEFEISRLPTAALRVPLRATASFVDGEWVAESVDLPLYGSGRTLADAKRMLEREIESLWDDLNDGSELSDEWTHVQRSLERAIQAP